MPQRYEREIEELLQRIEGGLGREPVGRRARRTTSRFEAFLIRVWGAFRRRTRVEQFMLAAITLALLSYVLRFIFPPAAFFAGIISVSLFVLAIGISLTTHHGYGIPGQRSLTSRTVQEVSESPPIWARALRWIRDRF